MSEDGLISFLLFFSLEKWLKRLIYYQNGCQIISWPSIMNWFTGEDARPDLGRSGALVLSCAPDRACPSSCHGMGLRVLMWIWGDSVCSGHLLSWWFWRGCSLCSHVWALCRNCLVFTADYCSTLVLLLQIHSVSSSACSDQITSTNLCLHNFFITAFFYPI